RERGRPPAARWGPRDDRVRETRGDPGGRPHRVPGTRDGGQRDRPDAVALLPRRLRKPLPWMIGTELLDDRRADPRAVRNELRDIARLTALFGGTRAVLHALEPVFHASCNVQRATGDVHWTLLDVGAGSGDVALAAAAAAARHGIELTPIGLEVIPAAARLTGDTGGGVVMGDGGVLPFAAKS